MNRFKFVSQVPIIAAALAFFSLSLEKTIAAPNKPNIVFIVGDDIGWTQTSVQMDPAQPFSRSDYHETPNLERLAAHGMRFSNAYSGGPMCSPSKIALLTGKSPAQTHMTDVIDAAIYPSSGNEGHEYASVLPMFKMDEHKTVADWLKAKSPEYGTALIRKDHVGAIPTEYGFDVFDFQLRGYSPDGEDPHKVFSTANRASAYMHEKVSQDQPFFMMIAPSAVHAPYQYRESTIQYFRDKPRGARHKSNQIAAATFELDAMVGQVLDELETLGIADNTYVFFTSDNGGSAAARFNEPLIGSKGNVWEGGVRVPFIVKGPGIAAHSLSSVPIIGTDLFATASDIAGITAPLDPMLESASIVPILHNGGQLPAGQTLKRAFGANGELFFHLPHYADAATPMSALRDGDFKLVRIYGQDNSPERIFLFNLAANLTESFNVASPLNLASQMPEKTASMLAKLDAWLTGVDASMPRRDSDPIVLTWNASDRGEYPTHWRSTTRIKDLRTETWQVVDNWPRNPALTPSLIDTSPMQPNLARQAYKFDGNDAMYKPYFRVSNPKPGSAWDTDNSATVTLWLKTDALNRNQLIFETGDAAAGLSISIGDGDGDGAFNEIRARVLGTGGASLTATAPLNLFQDPTRSFVEITAVISDDPSDRYLDLYINGALFSHIDGVSGAAGSLDWDGLDDAALGGTGGVANNKIGANGGAGLLPFVGGFRGQIAEMRFANFASNRSDVAAAYNSKFDAPNFRILEVSGQAIIPTARSVDLTQEAPEVESLLVFHESKGRLGQDMAVDAMVAASVSSGGMASIENFSPGLLHRNSEYASYLLSFDSPGNDGDTLKSIEGSITFADKIIGLVTDDNTLQMTDRIIGGIGNYGSLQNRGLILDGEANQIQISPDQRTISFKLSQTGNDAIQFRVLTAVDLSPGGPDFNNDGVVDLADLSTWRQAFGISAAGDANGDGQTDGADFLVWQRSNGMVAPSTPAFGNVPEPAALGLMAVGASLLLAMRRTARRVELN